MKEFGRELVEKEGERTVNAETDTKNAKSNTRCELNSLLPHFLFTSFYSSHSYLACTHKQMAANTHRDMVGHDWTVHRRRPYKKSNTRCELNSLFPHFLSTSFSSSNTPLSNVHAWCTDNCPRKMWGRGDGSASDRQTKAVQPMG